MTVDPGQLINKQKSQGLGNVVLHKDAANLLGSGNEQSKFF